ncbi:MAG: hypothetical protein HY729_05120 [Candidatus Rokubacteria bacterium]|nr:hypothetical protein [Candidatus Rokubacteria bacterium]
MSEPVTHALAIAATRTGRATDAVVQAESIGTALDAEIAAVGTLTTRAELRDLAGRIWAAQTAAGDDWVWSRRWALSGVATVRARAVALFGDAAWIAADVR